MAVHRFALSGSFLFTILHTKSAVKRNAILVKFNNADSLVSFQLLPRQSAIEPCFRYLLHTGKVYLRLDTFRFHSFIRKADLIFFAVSLA